MSTYLADKAEDLTVEGPSARFTYRRMGPQGGVPLVLLNRFRGTIDWWDPEFLDYLAADHDVIVFDNVGVGYTDGEPRASLEGFAQGAIESQKVRPPRWTGPAARMPVDGHDATRLLGMGK
ncbi:alpha/beta fold hydrolase [Streptomyces bobili]|uniref:alpha/beta fold hydrolase n=1 Tax=Streptomyces bobili TaxID=67280 RepID=UPI0037A60AE8